MIHGLSDIVLTIRPTKKWVKGNRESTAGAQPRAQTTSITGTVIHEVNANGRVRVLGWSRETTRR